MWPRRWCFKLSHVTHETFRDKGSGEMNDAVSSFDELKNNKSQIASRRFFFSTVIEMLKLGIRRWFPSQTNRDIKRWEAMYRCALDNPEFCLYLPFLPIIQRRLKILMVSSEFFSRFQLTSSRGSTIVIDVDWHCQVMFTDPHRQVFRGREVVSMWIIDSTHKADKDSRTLIIGRDFFHIIIGMRSCHAITLAGATIETSRKLVRSMLLECFENSR